MQGQNRSEVTVGIGVGIVLKQHQRSGNITEGIREGYTYKSCISSAWNKGQTYYRRSGQS